MLRLRWLISSVTLACVATGFAGANVFRQTESIIHVNELPERANVRPETRADGSPVNGTAIEATEMPLRDVIDLLRTVTDVDFVVDRLAIERAEVPLESEVTVRAERLSDALDQLRDTSGQKLAYAWHDPTGLMLLTADAEGSREAASEWAMQIHSAYDRAKRAVQAGSELGTVLSRPIGVPLEFEAVPMGDVVTFFENISSIEIVLHETLERHDLEQWEVPEVKLREDVPLGVVLQLTLDLCSPPEAGSLTWFIQGEQLLITADPLVSTLLAFDAVPLVEAVEQLAAATGTSIRFDERALKGAGVDPTALRSATISVVIPAERHLTEALTQISAQAHPGTRISRTPEGHYLITAGD